jgi:hypothetical protein
VVVVDNVVRSGHVVETDAGAQVDGVRAGLAMRRDDPRRKVFIMSMNIGAEGHNLQMFTRIYIMSPWWNAIREEQAIARCYRMGQTKDVHAEVYIAEGTLEAERMSNVRTERTKLHAGLKCAIGHGGGGGGVVDSFVDENTVSPTVFDAWKDRVFKEQLEARSRREEPVRSLRWGASPPQQTSASRTMRWRRRARRRTARCSMK